MLGGYETCDQNSERHEVPDREESEKHERRLARSNETLAAEREQEIDGEKKCGNGEYEPDPPREGRGAPTPETC